MASNGVWIITQDPDSGLVFTRHQLTTDMSDLLFREDSMVSNFDSISYFFLRFFRNARYIGRRNITPDLVAQLNVDFDAQLDVLRFNTNVSGLGAQIVDGRILSLERHPTLKDRIVANIELDLPAPFNVFELHLIAQTA